MAKERSRHLLSFSRSLKNHEFYFFQPPCSKMMYSIILVPFSGQKFYQNDSEIIFMQKIRLTLLSVYPYFHFKFIKSDFFREKSHLRGFSIGWSLSNAGSIFDSAPNRPSSTDSRSMSASHETLVSENGYFLMIFFLMNL